MSDTGTTTETTFEKISDGIVDVINVLAPIVEAADPALSTALGIGTKIIQGVIAAEPTAISLYQQIIGGTVPTAAQLATYAAQYDAAYTQLNNDINTKLKALAPSA